MSTVNSKKIPFLIRLSNELYMDFRDVVAAKGATRVGIIRLLIADYVRKNKGKRPSSGA